MCACVSDLKLLEDIQSWTLSIECCNGSVGKYMETMREVAVEEWSEP